MIKSFKHKGLQLFFETGTLKGIQADHAKKLRMRLIALDTAFMIEDLKLPGFDLHELEGNKKGSWSIKVNGNYRLTFTFENGDVYILNYEGYH
jgi:proteic killer suppression protein